MRYGGLPAVGARDELRRGHLVVVCSAHVALRSAGSPFGDGHGGYSFWSNSRLRGESLGSTCSRSAPFSSFGLREGLIPGQSSEHKGKLGVCRMSSSRTRSSRTTVSPSKGRVSASSGEISSSPSPEELARSAKRTLTGA